MEEGNHTPSPGFSAEERAQWGLPAVEVWEVTYPTENADPEETAYPSEAADAPETTAEAAGAPETTAQTANAPVTEATPPTGGPPRPRPEPSWPQVVAATIRLWLGRRAGRLRLKGGSRRPKGRRPTRLAGLAGLVVAVLLAALVVVLLTRGNTPRTTPPGQAGQPSPSGQPGRGGRAGPVRSAQAVRAQAAGWILAQVSRATIVSCDPVMCAALQARGFPAANLDVLRPGSADPLDSEVTVATGVLRSQFGSRLTSVYAPQAVASFGSGSASIQVREVAPAGGAAYLHELSADVSARKSFGRQLLRNPDVTAGPAARQELSQGWIDARLIAVIGTVAKAHRLRILSFGDAGPGASAGVPLRSVLLEATTGRSSGTSVLASVRSFLEGQQPPYLPAVARIVRLQAGHYALNVQYAVPDPLGLLGTGHSLATIPSGG